MRRISLESTIKEAYSVIDNSVINIKASVMGVCSDIARYFKLKFGMKSTFNEFDINQYNKIIENYPTLSKLGNSYLKELLDVFNRIRDINAHLHFNDDIKISYDLCLYLNSIINTKYKIIKNGNLTMYGQAFIISLLAQKYNLFPFYVSYFTESNFYEMKVISGSKKSKFQIDEQHKMQEYCGFGKVIGVEGFNSWEYQFLNDMFKRYMPRIIFNLEKECSNSKEAKSYFKSLHKYLKNIYIFDDEVESVDLINILRNCWFHGDLLGDTFLYNDEERVLTFEFILNSLTKIKKTLNKNEVKFNKSIKSIVEFAEAIFNFYALRLVEVSYKILDKRLLTENKVESRINGLKIAYFRLINTKQIYLELADQIIDSKYLEFIVSKLKFLDKKERAVITDKLLILKLHSNNGFEIGEYKTNKDFLYLVLTDLEKAQQNKINGKYLCDFIPYNEINLNNRISIYECEA